MNIITETPIDFRTEQTIEGYHIALTGLRELNQGSPVVGQLWVDGLCVFEHLSFGGPYVLQGRQLYIPVFVRKFCIVGFRLAVINLEKGSVEYLTGVKDLIYLKEVRDNTIYYYEDSMRQKENSIAL